MVKDPYYSVCGETNNKATPKHHNTNKMSEGGTHNAHGQATRATPLAVLTEDRRVILLS
jgi:hypothetical protein